MGQRLKKVNLKRRKIESVDVQKNVGVKDKFVSRYDRTLNHKALGKLSQTTIVAKYKGHLSGSILIKTAEDEILAKMNVGLRKTKEFGRELELTGLGVIVERRQEGFFEQMLAEAIHLAKENRVKAITLEVKEFNEVAKKAYSKMGFVEIYRTRKGLMASWKIRLRLGL